MIKREIDQVYYGEREREGGGREGGKEGGEREGERKRKTERGR